MIINKDINKVTGVIYLTDEELDELHIYANIHKEKKWADLVKRLIHEVKSHRNIRIREGKLSLLGAATG